MLLEENVQDVSNRYAKVPVSTPLSIEIDEIKVPDSDLEAQVHGQSDERAENSSHDAVLYGDGPGAVQYSATPLDYESLFSGPTKGMTSAFGKDEEYWSVTPVKDTEAETMSSEEARETLQGIQYAAVTGTLSEMDHTDRRRFALWAMLNTAERELQHRTYAFTSDVDYSRTF